MTVGLYARVSTKDKGQDPENQLISLREFARKNGWQTIEYVEKKSATGKYSRPVFDSLMEDARTRKIDMVFFWSLDRFSREGALETLQYLQQLTNWGVEWKSYTEQYLDSVGAFRDAVISIVAVIAKQESTRRSERAVAAIEKLRSKGTTEHLGRRKKIWPRGKAIAMRESGMSLREIQEALAKMDYKVSVRAIHREVQNVQVNEPVKSLSMAG